MENTGSRRKTSTTVRTVAIISRTRIKVGSFTIATSRASLAELWKTFSSLLERPVKEIEYLKDYFKIWVCLKIIYAGQHYLICTPVDPQT